MARPKVSIVLPNYNYARYLDERITSLLDQTFGNFELIIVDDGSTDHSRTVIDKYRDDLRIRPLLFDSNSGMVFQRWADGAAIARGEYLMFAGADDTCDPRLVETLVHILDDHPDVGVACAASWEIDSSGRRMRLKQRKPRWATSFIVSGEEEAPYMMMEPTIQNASAALFRRSLFESCGGFDLTLGVCADWMLWCRMLSRSQLAWHAEPLNSYRKHTGTVRAATRPLQDVLEQYRVIGFIHDSFSLSEQVRSESWERLALLWANKLLAERWHPDFRQHRRILKLARHVDQLAPRRVARIVRERTVAYVRRHTSERARNAMTRTN